MTVATVTGVQIRQGLVECGDWVFLGTQVGTTGASTTALPDATRLKGLNLPSTMFDNCIVRIASGTRQGDRAYVDYLDGANGILYLTPALGGTLADGDQYEIWLKGIDPDMVDRLRDDCLQKFCSQWRVVPLCLIPDGDMQSSAVTSWTVASGASRTKGFSTFPDAHIRRQLSVVHTTASTDWVESDAVNVSPGETFYLLAPVMAFVTATPQSPATASIDVRDKTNVAAITLGGVKTSHIGHGAGWISLLFTVPAGCYQISFRLKSDTNASTTIWGGIACHKRGRTRASLPDRITSRKRVGTFYTTGSVDASIATGADNIYKNAPFQSVERVQVGGQVEVYFNPVTSEFPIFFYERGYFDRLSAGYFTTAQRVVGDTATTDCQLEYIIAALATRVAKWYLDKYGEEWQDDWIRASADFNYWEGQMGPEPKLVVEVESGVYVPQLSV